MFAFRLKPDVNPEQQQRMLREIGELQVHIPLVLESAVGRNDSPRGQGLAIGGVMKFADKAALRSLQRASSTSGIAEVAPSADRRH